MSDAPVQTRPEPAAGLPGERVPVAPRQSRVPSIFGLRSEIPYWLSLGSGLLCLLVGFIVWWGLTLGSPEERLVAPGVLPSPAETFSSFHSLWFDRALTRNTFASLQRVVLGFGLAALVGVPVGVLCGSFPWINAFFAPLTIFGRNIPVAALIPLTFSFFGIGEYQKVMFIFIACVAFVVFDTARAVREVSSRYVDTAYTLGAGTRQIVLKVLVPLALPGIFNSLRLLFGLAFGYIMLAEVITFSESLGGLGNIINLSARKGLQTHIILVLMIIPVVALAIDRSLFLVQRELFPYQHGGSGSLHALVRMLMRGCEDVCSLFTRAPETAPVPPLRRHGPGGAAAGPAQAPPETGAQP